MHRRQPSLCGFIVVLSPLLVSNVAGCEDSEPRLAAGADVSSRAGMPSDAAEPPRDTGVQPVSAQPGQSPTVSVHGSAGMGSASQSMPLDASAATADRMPGASSGSAPDAGRPDRDPSPVVHDLSDKALAMWGSSVCDGFSVPSGTGWPWKVEKKLADIHGPKVMHVSTSGHTTDSKETSLERAKIRAADFVVVCLSLGNQGLGSAATDASAQAVVDSYVDDMFTDDEDGDGDPVSLVNYIQSLGAHPIVTLVYPMAGYSSLHCKHVVEANILQQAFGIATVNHLGPTNAGNDFEAGDCTWANGRNAPINVESDARHPNQLGHDENFYAFPPDLLFALASAIPFPIRPQTTDYLLLSQGGLASAPIRYTPAHAIHSYTMQFAFQASNDGTLAAIDLGMAGFLSLEIHGGAIRLLTEDGMEGPRGVEQVTNSAWHDVAITYSHVRQKLTLYVDGALVGEQDVRRGNGVRELFPRAFILGGPAASGRGAAPSQLQLRDLFINRTSLHAMEVKERATTPWVGAGSLDVYAPLRATTPAENRAQTLQAIEIQL